MENESKFTPNTLLNSLKESLNIHKDKFSCEEIQTLMNTIEDLDYEIHLIEKNYNIITKQHKLIKTIEENTKNILDNISKNNLVNSETNNEFNQNDEAWADHIATLIFQKIAAME